MKLKLKMIAVAAAMASLAGAAHADLTPASTNDGSLVLVAFDTVSRDWYMRDLGTFMNSFLPNSVTTLSGDGAVSGNKTPEAGLTLNSGNTTNFGDASFSGWLANVTSANVRWFVSSIDSQGTGTTTNVKRMITSSANAGEVATNGNLDGYIASGNAGALTTFFGTGTLSKTGTGDAAPAWDTNFNLGADGLATLDQGVGLFYFSRSFGTGSTTVQSNKTQFGNSLNLASVTLESDGDFSYILAPAVAAVPVPAAVWMMGSGLLALGGAARRRKAAAQA